MKRTTWIAGFLLILTAAAGFADDTGTSRTYGGFYTAERISNLRNNCAKYHWAEKKKLQAVAKAKIWLAKSDEQLWNMVPGQDLPRTIDVTFDRLTTGPKVLGCLSCGEKIFAHGNYPYEADPEKNPWKVTCPSCKAVFPTNDFAAYYRSAIDEKGVFNPAKGDKSLLFNVNHPDPKDPLHKFGVDDGNGFVNKDGREYRFVGYYTWKYWMYLLDGLEALADAYLYTGDKVYARKAAIILDRVADLYPEMDWKPYADRGWYHSDGGSNMGKIEGSISETVVVRQLADSYDKILSGTRDDGELCSFLLKQSEKYRLPASKGTREMFVQNVDTRILKTAFDGVQSRHIRGNQGMHQLSVAACALALNTNPTTTQWLDWLFAPDGGAIPGLMIARFDRDGTSDEGAPGYALMWGNLITNIARLLEDTTVYNKHNIFRDFPQFAAAYTAAYRMSVLGKASPNMGDTGSTGLISSFANPDFMATGYYYTRHPDIAVAAYRANGNSAKGLGRNIFSPDPEALEKEIEAIGKKAGPRPDGGYLMSGFGLAVLETGNARSKTALVSNYGRSKMHAHPDQLNFDLLAFDHWLAPDHGYPEFASKIPSNGEWTGSTLSHNLVFVDKKPQTENFGGHTVMYKQLRNFGAFELTSRKAYPGVNTYNRTMLLIDGVKDKNSKSNAYVIDIFRVVGGHDHIFSFHGPPGVVTTSGLKLETQEKGTYAGEDIPRGIWSKNFPIGFSHLYNVRKDINPPKEFMVDWSVAEAYRGLSKEDNIHLRLHALSPSNDVALAKGDPPQNKPGNPASLEYLLMHRAAPGLSSTFISVLEPYQNQPFIKSVSQMQGAGENEVTIRVDLVDGTTDYILYNPVEQKASLSNGISMNGTLGYIKEKNNRPVKGILINGTSLKYGKMDIKSDGVISGKVVTMNKQLSGGGWIMVDAQLPADGSLIGEQIIIDTDGERDATYTIKGIQHVGNQTKIDCGPISFVADYKGGTMEVRTFMVPRRYDQGYIYDFEEGAPFRITSHKEWKH